MELLSFKIFPLDGRIGKFLLFQLRNASLREDDTIFLTENLKKERNLSLKCQCIMLFQVHFFAKDIAPLMVIMLHTLLWICITRTIKNV